MSSTVGPRWGLRPQPPAPLPIFRFSKYINLPVGITSYAYPQQHSITTAHTASDADCKAIRGQYCVVGLHCCSNATWTSWFVVSHKIWDISSLACITALLGTIYLISAVAWRFLHPRLAVHMPFHNLARYALNDLYESVSQCDAQAANIYWKKIGGRGGRKVGSRLIKENMKAIIKQVGWVCACPHVCLFVCGLVLSLFVNLLKVADKFDVRMITGGI